MCLVFQNTKHPKFYIGDDNVSTALPGGEKSRCGGSVTLPSGSDSVCETAALRADITRSRKVRFTNGS
jgi:hypothetical protein